MLVSSGNSRLLGLDRLDVLPVHKLIWLDVCRKGWSDGFEGLEPNNYSFYKIAKPKKRGIFLDIFGRYWICFIFQHIEHAQIPAPLISINHNC